MTNLTTAQRLAAYRAELKDAGFSPAEAWRLVEAAAPLVNETKVQADFMDGLMADLRSRMPNSGPAQAVRPTKRTISAVGGLLRVYDEFSDGKGDMWDDSHRIEVLFSGGDSSEWTTHFQRIDARPAGER